MPTECERSLTSPTSTQTAAGSTAGGVASAALIAAEIQSSQSHEDLSHQQQLQQQQQQQQQQNNQQISMMEGDMSTSQTSTTSNGSSCNGGIRKTSITSPDPTAYVAKARVTRPTPPPPPYNPMQFVQIKPCNLYQTAQEQLKKAEEVKKIKEIRKEEPEDWQNNLDNWKSSRRKRVEHIIDRVVEVKKLELEEHDRSRRKSKTFSELIENRGERVGRPGLNKLASLAVYNEDESNDLSDLGIGTSSASGKSSLSEDYDNNSVMSDNAAELDKAISNSNHHKPLATDSTTREYISSPGYETSSSTAPASSPDPCEYTYEGAIQDYKQRVSRAAASGLTSQALNKLSTQAQQTNSKESTPERAVKETAYPPRRGSKIEDRLIGFEVQSPSEECVGEKNKVDVPKIDISKRKEIFESQTSVEIKETKTAAGIAAGGVPRVTLRDRFKPQDVVESLESSVKKDSRRLSGDITSIKERLQNLEQQNLVNGANGASKSTANKLVDIPVPPLKERLSSLQSAVTKEEVRKPPVALVDARQLEIMKSEEEKVKQQTIKEEQTIKAEQTEIIEKQNLAKDLKSPTVKTTTTTTTTTTIAAREIVLEESEVDRDDSGIHTADDIDIVEDRVHTEQIKKQQERKLNAAIEALAMEEKQFAEAASAVNQIEAEFEELSLGSVTLPPLASKNTTNGTGSTGASAPATNTNSTAITNDHMEYSVSSTNQNLSSLSSSKSPKSPGSGSSSVTLLPNVVEVKGGSQVSVEAAASAASRAPACNLKRKPTNEMVHAKNLLKIFNETFQNDIELDEGDDDHRCEQETKQIPKDLKQNEKVVGLNEKSPVGSPCVTPCSPLSTTMNSRCVEPSFKTPLSPISVKSNMKVEEQKTSPVTYKSPWSPITVKPNRKMEDQATSPDPNETLLAPISVRNAIKLKEQEISPVTQKSPLSPIIIRSSTKFKEQEVSPENPKTPMSPFSMRSSTKFKEYETGPAVPFKSPLSPVTVRSTTKFKDETPPGSPSATRKHDSQFSINGRVEIFNSKTMTTSGNDPFIRASTPNMTAKKTHLPHITTTQATPPSTPPPKSSDPLDIRLPQQQQEEEAITTVSVAAVVTALQAQAAAAAKTATTTTVNEKKSMPLRHMVNEPHHKMPATLDARVTATTTTTTTASHEGDGKEQQPEVIVCAPPITIVNPDELPKPNTVKNLSSCFQQQHQNAPAPIPASGVGGKLMSPKPLLRSHNRQATPPQSPTATKRTTAVVIGTGEKIAVIWPPPSPASTSTTTPLDEEKKLSMISTSSSLNSSSNTTVCTVIEANQKKLSTMSNSSTISTDSSIQPPTVVTTNAQVHQGEEKQNNKGNLKKPSVEEKSQTKNVENQKIQSSEFKTPGVTISAAKSNEGKSAVNAAKENEISVVKDDKKPTESKPMHKKDQDLKTETTASEVTNSVKIPKIQTVGNNQVTSEVVSFAEFKKFLINFLKTEREFSESCEMQRTTLPKTPLVINKDSPVPKEENSKQSKIVQRKPSLKKDRDTERPLKTVAFSEEIQMEPTASEIKTKELKANETKSNEVKGIKTKTNDTKVSDTKTDHEDSKEPDVDIKALQSEFLQTETEFSRTCEINPVTPSPYKAPLQPIKVVIRDNEGVKEYAQKPNQSQAKNEEEMKKSEPTKESQDKAVLVNQQSNQLTPTLVSPLTPVTDAKPPLKLPQSQKPPLTIDIRPMSPTNESILPSTPLSPSSQLFKTTKPLVVSTLYDKYESPKSPVTEQPYEFISKKPTQPPNNQRPLLPSPKQADKPSTPNIIIPAVLPHLVDCPPNDSTLYKLASSAPHSPVTPTSPDTAQKTLEMDSALCNSLLSSMAATPDMINFQRPQIVEEPPCQKVDVNNLPPNNISNSTDYVEITKEDVKQSEGFVSKIIHRMQSPKMKRQIPVQEEPCQKVDVRDMPDGKYTPVTDFKSISPSDIQKCDKFFTNPLARPQSPINEARAAHSKALIETCEKIIAEEKEVNNQMKSSLPRVDPQTAPAVPRKNKAPKPLASCCKGVESLNEADFQEKPITPKIASPPDTPPTAKDEAVIARMHVVETQIKVTTTTPPDTPKEQLPPKPQASPQTPKKSKNNIFDFLKKNFGVGGSNNAQKETEAHVVDSPLTVTVAPPPPPSVVKSDNQKVLVLTPEDVKNFNEVKFDEIHNVDNSKFYLPSDDVAPPPLPKSPAPVNIEITRKIITDEILEDGKTEMEFTDEIDALLDVEMNKLNQEIEEMEKAGKK